MMNKLIFWKRRYWLKQAYIIEKIFEQSMSGSMSIRAHDLLFEIGDYLADLKDSEKMEHIASLNDQKAFEAINLGTLKRSRVKDSGGEIPKCPQCGTRMSHDIATLDKIDWYCHKCHPPINPLDVIIEEKPPESLEPCKTCKFLISNINKFGDSYCHELDFKMRDFPEKCIHSKPKDKQHLTLKGAISFLSEHGKNLVYTKEEIKHLVDAFLMNDVIISQEALRSLILASLNGDTWDFWKKNMPEIHDELTGLKKQVEER